MTVQKDSSSTYLIIGLLVVAVLTLFSIDDELKAQRTPEQIAAMAKQDKLRAEAQAFMEAEHQQNRENLKATPWAEISSFEEGVLKAWAHNYPIWLVGLIIIFSGPTLMRKYKGL